MKFISKKVISGSSYYYLQYAGKTKSLGTSLPIDLKDKFVKFFELLGEESYRELVEGVKKYFPYGDLMMLERLHYWFICFSESELFYERYRKFFRDFTILFIFNSNRSEGSKVTWHQIEKISVSKIRKPKTKTEREVLNSFSALRYAFSNEMKWNLKSIKKIHELLVIGMEDSNIVGKWKNENNIAPGNAITTDYRKVEKEMKELLVWFKKEQGKKIYPPILSLEFYTRFERIHPFLDGNGRVGRILLNTILFQNKYMPVIFFTDNHITHCEAISQALEGRKGKLSKHFLEQVKKSYKSITS